MKVVIKVIVISKFTVLCKTCDKLNGY